MKQLRVLVADDNEDHLFLTVRALRDAAGADLDIDTVTDGEEALDYLRGRNGLGERGAPHLIFLDLKMPKVDGLEVLREVKSDPDLRLIPTVVLTSSERPEDVRATYELGGNSYVTKPTSVSGLREGLRTLGEYWTELASLPAVSGAS